MMTLALAPLILAALPVRAQEKALGQASDPAAAISQACADRNVEVRLAGAPGRREKRDTKNADRFLGMKSWVDDSAKEGPTLHWDRGQDGQAGCVKKLTELDRRYPGRLRFPKVERRQLAQDGARMRSQVPDAVRRDPHDASLQAGLFDASRPGAAPAAEPVSVPMPQPRPAAAPGSDVRPRRQIPASYTRPYSEPPLPGASLALDAGSVAGLKASAARVMRGGMAIDTDGDVTRGDPRLASMARRDPYRQSRTALRYSDGRSLDPTRVPFVVIPGGSGMARLGDFVLVQYGGRSVLAVVGDVGPRHKFGEGSMALAQQLGVNPSGVSGGVSGGVTYTFLGRGSGPRPASQEMLLAGLEQATSFEVASR
ncbi:MAG: hypothetical protein KGL53_14175 [Elusimicrobia bacterium]|nr:hypothetical protein [Elusimicrobiota bacterium]